MINRKEGKSKRESYNCEIVKSRWFCVCVGFVYICALLCVLYNCVYMGSSVCISVLVSVRYINKCVYVCKNQDTRMFVCLYALLKT